jgi:hypothetical protein
MSGVIAGLLTRLGYSAADNHLNLFSVNASFLQSGIPGKR